MVIELIDNTVQSTGILPTPELASYVYNDTIDSNSLRRYLVACYALLGSDDSAELLSTIAAMNRTFVREVLYLQSMAERLHSFGVVKLERKNFYDEQEVEVPVVNNGTAANALVLAPDDMATSQVDARASTITNTTVPVNPFAFLNSPQPNPDAMTASPIVATPAPVTSNSTSGGLFATNTPVPNCPSRIEPTLSATKPVATTKSESLFGNTNGNASSFIGLHVSTGGTLGAPFFIHVERDHDVMNHFQSITFMAPYSTYSFEVSTLLLGI